MGEFLDAYRRAAQSNQQADTSTLQQAGSMVGIMEHLRSQQQDAQLRQALTASGGDLNKALQAAVQSGNLAGAAKLAPLIKLQQEQEQTKAIAGVGQMSPDQLDVLGQKLAAADHSGASTIMNIADKRRTQATNQNTIGMMREQPTPVTETPTLGINNRGTAERSIIDGPEPTADDVPPEVRAAMASGKPFAIGVGQSNNPADNQQMSGGVLTALAGSAAPAIAQRARYLQNQINNPGFKGDLTTLQREIDNLTRMQQGFDTAAARPKPVEALEKVLDANGVPILTPRSQAAGMTPAPTTSAAGAGALSPEALKLVAKQFLAGDRQAIQGFARSAPARIAIQNAITEEATAQGLSGPAIAAKMAEFAGIVAGSRAVGTRGAQIELASNEASQMMDVVRQQSAKFGRTNFIPFNRALASFEGNTGQPEVKALGAAINSLVNVYARAINPSGVATDSDKNHARAILATADSPEQVDAVLSVMQQEMQAARNAPADVRAATRAAVTGVARPAADGKAPPPPSGFKVLQ